MLAIMIQSNMLKIIINIFAQRHGVLTSEVLGPGSVLVVRRSMRESLRGESLA